MHYHFMYFNLSIMITHKRSTPAAQVHTGAFSFHKIIFLSKNLQQPKQLNKPDAKAKAAKTAKTAETAKTTKASATKAATTATTATTKAPATTATKAPATAATTSTAAATHTAKLPRILALRIYRD
jgi:hypothetical protein